jgi:deoxyadenosine/deoxycytidine kinase
MKNVVFLQEPVDEWDTIRDKDNETILSKFYGDQMKYSFAFQMMAYISRLALLKKTVEQNPNAVIITERCLNTDREVFARMLFDKGHMEEVEYQIYIRWFYTFQSEFPITHYVYLKTDPKTAYERVLKRNRPGEKIEDYYLARCHRYHENWLQKAESVVTIDANKDENEMIEWAKIVSKLIEENKKSNDTVYAE